MYQRSQWVVSDEKKRPINPKTGRFADPTDAKTCGTYAEACAMVDTMRASGRIVHLGFVLTADDPYVCIDLDKCRDPDTGNIEPWALEIVEAIGSYTEISPSGTGLHIWMLATMPGDRNRAGHFEIYGTDRYMTVTGRSLPGYPSPVRSSQEPLNALYAQLFPTKPTEPRTAATALSMDERDIIDQLQRDQKGRALLAGDTSGHDGNYSRARMALAWKARWFHADESQIASILRSSPLWKNEHSDKERDRRSAHDARTTIETYTGSFHEPNYKRPPASQVIVPKAPPTPPLDNVEHDPMTMAELRAKLQASRQREAAKDQTIRAQAEIIDSITTILASDQREAGQRLTSIGVLLVGLEKRAKGEQPTEFGYHMPASWIARKTGQTPKTISTHLRKLAGTPEKNKPGVIDRTVRYEKVQIREEVTDNSTGEIWTETREDNGKRNYIALPDNIIDYATRIASHVRTEEEEKDKHGGSKQCSEHPDAGTYTEHVTKCRQCKKILDERTTINGPLLGTVIPINDHDGYESSEEAAPDESIPKMGLSIVTSPGEVSVPKTGIDSEPEHPAPSSMPEPAEDKDLSGKMREGGYAASGSEPAELWESSSNEADALPPGWQEERARIYGHLYRGEAVS